RGIQQEAERGVPFDQIAVLLRSPVEYRPHLEEAFRRATLPAYFARGTTRPDPAGRALLALLACAGERLSARRFAEYLSLGQVPDAEAGGPTSWVSPDRDLVPGAASAGEPEEAQSMPQPIPLDPDSARLEGSLRAPWRWDRLVVDASVIGGKDRWARRL